MIDYIIIGIIAFSIIVSLLRGFVREVMSLASWVVAFIVASQFYPYLATYLTQIESDYVRNGTAIDCRTVTHVVRFDLSKISGEIRIKLASDNKCNDPACKGHHLSHKPT